MSWSLRRHMSSLFPCALLFFLFFFFSCCRLSKTKTQARNTLREVTQPQQAAQGCREMWWVRIPSVHHDSASTRRRLGESVWWFLNLHWPIVMLSAATSSIGVPARGGRCFGCGCGCGYGCYCCCCTDVQALYPLVASSIKAALELTGGSINSRHHH
jgi:hypothetical protein